jgi:hypothetical protein
MEYLVVTDVYETSDGLPLVSFGVVRGSEVEPLDVMVTTREEVVVLRRLLARMREGAAC